MSMRDVGALSSGVVDWGTGGCQMSRVQATCVLDASEITSPILNFCKHKSAISLCLELLKICKHT